MADSSSDLEILSAPPPKRPASRAAPPPRVPSDSPAPPVPLPTSSRSSREPNARPRARRFGQSTSEVKEEKGKGVRKASPPVKRKKVVVDISSDEANEFFAKAPPKPTASGFRKPRGAKAVPAKVVISSSSSSSSRSSSPDPDSHSKPSKGLKLPAWTRGTTGASAKMALGGMNRKKRVRGQSTSEEEVEEKKASGSESDDEWGDRKPKVKEKVVREKSRSLTPPVPAGAHIIEEALYGLHEILGRVRSPSPVFHLSSDDDIHLDPALRRIRDANASDEIQIVDPPTVATPEEKVTLRISMVFDPTRIGVASSTAVEGYQRQMEFELGRTESFSNLYTALADRKGLEAAELVLTHNDHRVYPFGTPRSLKIWSSADLRGYTSEVWAKVLAAKVNGGKQEVVVEEEEKEEVVEEKKEEPLFKITVRGSAIKVLSLVVKRSTTLSTLLKQYCRTYTVPPEQMATMWMEFDGEKLDLAKTLEEYKDEIEEEEAVDVREPK